MALSSGCQQAFTFRCYGEIPHPPGVTMSIVRQAFAHPLLALGSTLLWGVIELVALQRRARRAPRDSRV